MQASRLDLDVHIENNHEFKTPDSIYFDTHGVPDYLYAFV
jgi:hypothetical protein